MFERRWVFICIFIAMLGIMSGASAKKLKNLPPDDSHTDITPITGTDLAARLEAAATIMTPALRHFPTGDFGQNGAHAVFPSAFMLYVLTHPTQP